MPMRPAGAQENLDRLREGKKRMKEACMQLALENTPTTVDLVVFRKKLSGAADYCGKVIIVPRPFTRRALHVFLHECAHIFLGHFDGKYTADYQAEFAAERWATAKMRAAGIPVSRKDIQGGKRYVARKIWQALYDGCEVDPKVRRWALTAVDRAKWKEALTRIPRRTPLKLRGPVFV